MSQKQTATGEYTNKENNEIVTFDFEFLVIEDVADAIDDLGENTCKSILQRMIKTDARNGASLKAQAQNGHNTRAGLTEDQKETNKAERKSNSEILQALKAKGLTLADIAGM